MSQSYIRIVCTDEAEPRYNRLRLRTEPPTFIELQPGENILSVNDYPDLKFGFKQDETIPTQVRCEDVIEVDFSQFDGSCLETMEGMFDYMMVEKITFGLLNTPNLKNAARAFSHVGIPIKDWFLKELDLSSLDFSKVENMMGMFQGANVLTLRIENANLNNLMNGRNLIRHCMIENLILDGLQIKDPKQFDIHPGPSMISLRRCDHSTICSLIEIYETKCAKNADAGKVKWEPATYILDKSLEYSISRTPDGQVKCVLNTIKI